jgi:hypothetical protein
MRAVKRALLVFFLALVASNAFAWGEKGHYLVNEAATWQLPTDMPIFFHKAYPELIFLAYRAADRPAPDVLRRFRLDRKKSCEGGEAARGQKLGEDSVPLRTNSRRSTPRATNLSRAECTAGLRISDAVRLDETRVKDGRVFLCGSRRRKRSCGADPAVRRGCVS